jgi:hypothetical protein
MGRYLTLDRWRDRAAYESFRRSAAADYAALDAAREALTNPNARSAPSRRLDSGVGNAGRGVSWLPHLPFRGPTPASAS